MATPHDPVVSGSEPVYSAGARFAPPAVDAERSAIASPVGWSAIFAGAAVTVGLWLVLHLLGIGIGMTAIDPDDASSLRGVGVGTGIWSMIAPLIALFVGGVVVGRVAPTINSGTAAIHGAVVWAVAALASMALLSMMLGTLVRGVAATGSAVGKAAGSAISAVGDVSLDDLGLDGDDLVAPINQRLQAQGKPAFSAAAFEAAVKDAVRTSMRQGRVDRETLVTSLANRTELSRADAEQLATQIERRVDETRARGGQLADRAQETALAAAETAGKLVLVLAVMMLLGLAAAIAGAVLSVRHERRAHVVLPTARMT